MPTKVRIVKAMVFPEVIYGCESWTIKKVETVKVAQSCLALCNPMDYIVQGVLQPRILEWVTFPFSRGSSQSRDEPSSPALQVDSLPVEPPGKPGWALKNWCFCIVVLEKTLESPLDSKEIQPVHSKGDQSWVFIGRTDVEALGLWPPDMKSWLTGKNPDSRKDWRQKEKKAAEDEMVGEHHWLNGHKLGQTLGDSEGQGGLLHSSSCGHTELDMT